ncbi:hypothetical protein E2320_009404 [Naja naja]|nr:hypothetical protein E2320_009404 [Naja naja]
MPSQASLSRGWGQEQTDTRALGCNLHANLGQANRDLLFYPFSYSEPWLLPHGLPHGPGALPARPGLCPRRRVLPSGNPCPNQCEDDRGCSSGQKCCFTGCGLECLRPRADPPRPKCQDCCRDDSDCAKEEKCHSTACGFQCHGPPPGKPGVCPLLLRGSLGPCLEKTLRTCTHDFDCEKAKKCCSNGCTMVCKEPGEGQLANWG